ncbi:MAG: dTDP-4-dehydrorhamnose 3,5-epimerase family protein [Planctomycetes bacterium]|nr:dTDP-4-dehydrorhamnose 3,5-epimerase family protein [Planctomycetota bacterium]
MIEGVKVKPLKVHCDERGRLVELLRCDDELFEQFGQVYVTTAYPGVVKAWHYHDHQTDHFVALAGMVKVVLYDSREGSPTQGEINEFFAGVHNPILIKIPARVYHGYKCISEQEAIMINIPTQPYNHSRPDEYRVAPDDPSIPYNWERKNG